MIRKATHRRKRRKKSLRVARAATRLAARKRRLSFLLACEGARMIGGTLTERLACALGYLGSSAGGFDWEDIKRMLGES